MTDSAMSIDMPDTLFLSSTLFSAPSITATSPCFPLALRLHFDGRNAAVVDTPNVAELDARKLDQLADLLRLAAGFLPTWQAAGRLAVNHPSRFGLVPASGFGITAHANLRSTYSASRTAEYLLPHLPEEYTALHPQGARRNSPIGWFLPDADPTEYGTPYLSLTAVDDIISGALTDGEMGWAVRHVAATERHPDVVSWEDEAGMREAVAALDVSGEMFATERYLAHSATVEREVAAHTRHLHVQAVSDVLESKRYRIPPKVAETALAHARALFRTRDAGPLFRIEPVGVNLTEDVFEGRRAVTPVWAAKGMSISCPSNVPMSRQDQEAEVKHFAMLLRRSIDPARLGSVVVTRHSRRDSDTYSVLLVKRPDLVCQFPAAFNLPASVEVLEG